MVRDGIYYALAMLLGAAVLGWLTVPAMAVIPGALAVFFLWFFRDPERAIPQLPHAVVSPADGKVTAAALVEAAGERRVRISIFMNVFDVHVNRSPVAGVITACEYRKGRFDNAMGAASAEANEQSICTLRTDEGQTIIFKQIAGLLARRIVFNRRVGERVERGERVGLIKFGSRCDVLLPAESQIEVKVGDKVKGGSSILGALPREHIAVPSSQRAEDGRAGDPVSASAKARNLAGSERQAQSPASGPKEKQR
ncbi:MAG: phosphatidylserine decarboxylase family protein [Candidatus Korobacteraceae bacterium]|jgi:phosphatidylserine decarboxylase